MYAGVPRGAPSAVMPWRSAGMARSPVQTPSPRLARCGEDSIFLFRFFFVCN